MAMAADLLEVSSFIPTMVSTRRLEGTLVAPKKSQDVPNHLTETSELICCIHRRCMSLCFLAMQCAIQIMVEQLSQAAIAFQQMHCHAHASYMHDRPNPGLNQLQPTLSNMMPSSTRSSLEHNIQTYFGVFPYSMNYLIGSCITAVTFCHKICIACRNIWESQGKQNTAGIPQHCLI
jgi:hypothetical protein